jgi:RNA 2',3'-cyclic 3'-phosphodiesterase
MGDPSEHSSVKVFFALWPTVAERSHLTEWLVPLKELCGGRVMHDGTLHTTLVFIGDIKQSRLEALQLAAQEVSVACFELCFDEARYWGHNHIVYAAPGYVPQQLANLVDMLKQGLKRHRFKFDQRDYKPHVTLLRNAHWTDAPLPAMQPVCWQIQDFALVQSVNENGLASYRALTRFALLNSD